MTSRAPFPVAASNTVKPSFSRFCLIRRLCRGSSSTTSIRALFMAASRHLDGECRAPAGPALDPDPAAVRFDDLSRQVESYDHASLFACEEGAENPRQPFRFDSPSRIRNADENLLASSLGFNRYSPPVRGFAGVAQQVG